MSEPGETHELMEGPRTEPPAVIDAGDGEGVAPSTAPVRAAPWIGSAARALEGLLLLTAPLIVFVVLHERAMAPVDMVDPAVHTAFIMHPRDLLEGSNQGPSLLAWNRELARVGFLVPARAAYLLFGAVPGFFVTRYLFALIAIVPTYLLLRRVGGPAAGAIGVLVILSSPVALTSWGTDYPDSAAFSYLTGGLACLAYPGEARGRSGRVRSGAVVAAGVLFTLAAWSQTVTAALILPALVAAVAVRLWRDRSAVLRDLGLLVGLALAVTAALIPVSAVEIGRANFFTPNLDTLRTFSLPVMVARYHSRSWVWAPYLAYLLVPPAVLGAWLVSIGTTLRRIPTPFALLGGAAAGQLVAYAYLQFGRNVETLEYHYFSSMLWGSVLLTFAAVLTVIAAPLLRHPVARWIPSALLLVVPLVYEHIARLPTFGWHGTGVTLAIVVIAIAIFARAADRLGGGRGMLIPGAALAGMITSVLLLTAASIPAHGRLPDTAKQRYPDAAYESALGGDGTALVRGYRVAADLPAFVGGAARPGKLLQWWPPKEQPLLYREVGMYHAGSNRVTPLVPHLTGVSRKVLALRRPDAILLIGLTTKDFRTAVANLAPYQPMVVRTAAWHSGGVRVHVWLVTVHAFATPVH